MGKMILNIVPENRADAAHTKGSTQKLDDFSWVNPI